MQVPAVRYRVYFYVHGGPRLNTTIFPYTTLFRSNNYGTKATTTNSDWSSAVWQEGRQYVVFRDVGVVNGGRSEEDTSELESRRHVVCRLLQDVQKSSAPPPVAGPLLDIDFGVGTSSAKVGFAATGQSAADFWNLYSRDDGSGG